MEQRKSACSNDVLPFTGRGGSNDSSSRSGLLSPLHRLGPDGRPVHVFV